MTNARNAPNQDLLDRIAEDFANQPDVAMGTMFRSPGLRTSGKIFAFLGHDGELIVKLPQDRARQLVDAGTAEHVTMGTRTMREWVAVPAGGDDTATLALWRDAVARCGARRPSVRRLPAPVTLTTQLAGRSLPGQAGQHEYG